MISTRVSRRIMFLSFDRKLRFHYNVVTIRRRKEIKLCFLLRGPLLVVTDRYRENPSIEVVYIFFTEKFPTIIVSIATILAIREEFYKTQLVTKQKLDYLNKD